MNRDDELSLAEIQARNARWNLHRQLRVEKGRPWVRVVTRQWRADANRYRIVDTVAPDPILDLYVARERAILFPADPRAQLRYGEIRQAVISPLSGRLP